jgi:hypothetical protein|tara:strand:- start:115 stop:366 length:252 start_codon:yes stop_codon:yes gene_type:complete
MTPEKLAEKHLFKTRAYKDNHGGDIGACAKAIVEGKAASFEAGIGVGRIEERDDIITYIESTDLADLWKEMFVKAIRARGEDK